MHRRSFVRFMLGTAFTLAGAAWGQAPLKELGDVSLLTPLASGYTDAAALFNPRLESAPMAVAQCRSAADIARCLAFCRHYGVPFAVRCGGHSYEGFSTTSGLMLDVRGLDTLSVQGNTARIGAGLRLAAVYQALGKHDLALAAGTCPTVGISGYTLGGGYGVTGRRQGLAVDNLLSLDLVDANGRQMHASREQNADLFWACRGGGGGNFGVVTAFEFRLLPVRSVSTFAVSWPFEQLPEAVRRWIDWAPHAPEELTSSLSLPGKGQGDVTAVGLFLGSRHRLEKLLRNGLLGAHGPHPTVETLPLWDALAVFGGHSERRSPPFKACSDFVRVPFGTEALATLVRFLSMHGPRQGRVQLDAYGGAINRVPVTETPFPHRQGTLFCMQYHAYWKQPQDAEPNLAWLRDFQAAMRPFVTGGAYQNYCDTGLTDWGTAYYGANLDRLRQVKRQYDPDNVFQHAQSIPPA